MIDAERFAEDEAYRKGAVDAIEESASARNIMNMLLEAVDIDGNVLDRSELRVARELASTKNRRREA